MNHAYTNDSLNRLTAAMRNTRANLTGGTPTNGTDSTIGWDGCVFNAATGDYLVRHRTYLPPLGRWGERDGQGYRDGLNVVAYVRGRPVRSLDSLGLSAATGDRWIDEQPFRSFSHYDYTTSPCNCGEVALTGACMMLSPWLYWEASSMGERAKSAANELDQLGDLPGVADGGPADAFRHCYWSCEMARAWGDDLAKRVADAQEACDPRNTPADMDMGLTDNEFGRRMAKDSGYSCYAGCLKAARRGWLNVLPPYSPGFAPPGATPVPWHPYDVAPYSDPDPEDQPGAMPTPARMPVPQRARPRS